MQIKYRAGGTQLPAKENNNQKNIFLIDIYQMWMQTVTKSDIYNLCY